MQEPQNTTAYRLALALSLAFCLHIMFFLVIGQWPETTQRDEPRVVEVRLTQPGTEQQAAESVAAPPGTEEESRETETPAEESSASPAQDPVVATDDAPDSAPQESEQSKEPRPETSVPSPPSSAGTAASESVRQLFGGESAPETEEEDAPVAHITEEEEPELSDYELKLWEAIAQEIRYHEQFAELEAVHQVTLGLRLMPNGALERTRIEQSSGHETLDEIARQAAISASPYPEPPNASQWFTVKLRFLPDGQG